ncbi:MAG: hypothetical protein WC309_01635 [Candidatus Paceibacterota bacterium]|jgi:hypothetical protein
MGRYIVYNDDEVSSYSNWDTAKKDASDLTDVNCPFYAVRILTAEEEKELEGWHNLVVGLEKILGLKDTAESALMSNLPNILRDMKVELDSKKEFAWKQFITGWQQAKLGSVNAESIFKKLWKEQS